MESNLIQKECDICCENVNCFPMPCCKEKFICSSCLTKFENKQCPYCRKTIHIDTQTTRISNIPKVNCKQCVKVILMIIYAISAGFCLFLMGYGLETGMKEMSMFAMDMAIFSIANIIHIGLWQVIVTSPYGREVRLSEEFGIKYYLGNIFQNAVYVFFFFFFNDHFFLNSMTFIMFVYNFALTPIYHMTICLWNQMTQIFSYQERITVNNVTYDTESEPSEEDYRSIDIVYTE